MTSILDRIGTLLGGAGVGTYSTTVAIPAGDTAIVIGATPQTDDPAVALSTYPGGPEPDSWNGWEHPRMQVRVRHPDPLAALDLDAAVFQALQASPGKYPTTLTGWELQDCYALQSAPAYLGKDETGRHEYVRNYQLTCRPA